MPPQTFEATPTLVGTNVQWELCHTNPDPDKCGTNNGNYPDVMLLKGSGAHTFQFTIVGDQTAMGIKFATTDPLVIKTGEPVGPGTEKQIGPPNGNGTKVLTFVDKNSMPNQNFPAPVVLDYQLNFIDKNGKAVTEIDPEITNGGTTIIEPPPGSGGSGGYSQSEYITAAAIALLVGILIGFVVHKMFFGSKPVG